jgi:hypothetical protein
MYKIQDGVPKPKPVTSGSSRRRKYPLDQLEVGQFFLVPHRKKNNLTTHVSTTGRKLGRVFSTRLVWMREDKEQGDWVICEEGDENAVTGIGVWRDE